MEKLKETDGYIEALSGIFKGEILLISDHGVHETGDGGTHGENPCSNGVYSYNIEDMLAVWGEHI